MESRLEAKYRAFAMVAIVLALIALISWLLLPPGWRVSHSRHNLPRPSAPIPSTGGKSNESLAYDPASGNRGQKPGASGTEPSLDQQAKAALRALLENRRRELLEGPFGKMPIPELLRALVEIPGGPELQTVLKTLAVRKEEALPLVKDRLRTGTMYEKYVLTKFLGSCPWPETGPELLALAKDKTENSLPRTEALYALGTLGDASMGPEVAALLENPADPKVVKLVAMPTLARIGYREGANAIRPFAEDPDIHMRLFAAYSLAELGEPVSPQFVVECMQHQDYIVRQEACQALATLGGTEVTEVLQSVAKNERHEGVRDSAIQGLMQREIQGKDPAEKLAILRRNLQAAERHSAVWILQTILKQCGDEGRAFLGTLAAKQDRLGERSLTYLLYANSNSQ
ncbi:MAG: HEAT repeat domain-containing protein [Verrucomicrobia bacterium]|nr:HEAT repeat domain-containing protein [Verrucomicrobiota bacterium]